MIPGKVEVENPLVTLYNFVDDFECELTVITISKHEFPVLVLSLICFYIGQFTNFTFLIKIKYTINRATFCQENYIREVHISFLRNSNSKGYLKGSGI